MAKMKTYEEWLGKGRHVRRGEKAKDFDDFGRALFSKKQTDKTEERQGWHDRYDRYDPDYFGHGQDYDHEDMRDYGSLGDIY